MLNANIYESLSTLTASQLTMLLVMRKGLDFGYDYTFTDDDGQSATVDHVFLAAEPGDLLEVIFEENEHDDAINEVRYEAEDVSGIPEWCHYSWGRNYEVDVKAFILPDGRALAFCEMSGGGKHGEPNAYSWPWLACMSGHPLDRQPGDTRAETAARAVVHNARGETINVPKEVCQ